MRLSKTTVVIFIFLGLLTVLHQTKATDDEDSINVDDYEVEVPQNAVEDSDNDDEDNIMNVSDDINYESPTADPPEHFYFAENFDNKNDFEKKWVKSQARKDDIAEEIAKYDGEWDLEEAKKQTWKNDYGLVLKSKAKHAAIASKLSKPFVFDQKPLIVQYEVTMQDGQNCGGSYLKLLSSGKNTEDLTKFNDKTPYTIMFGPDKCGNDIKLHFIFRHVNPINGSVTEKHCRKPRERLEEPFKDKLPHLYQLILRPDNTFEIKVDHRIVNQGSLLNDFEPPVNPPKEINDPNDKKPDDWDEREKIPDPTAKKPDDWDEDAPPQIPDPSAVKPADWLDNEEEMIPDPNAKKPDDWDTEMDGEWEPPLIQNPACENAVGCGKWKAPLVSNPEYKGKWRAPLIDNPNYQGKWLPKKIPNPDFFEDLHPFEMTTISAVGIEIWSMSNDILFDNIIITDESKLADEWAAKTFDLKRKQIDKDSKTLWHRAMRYMGYKPHWWAVYFFYISIPIGIFIRFLRRAAKEDTFVGKLVKLTNDNPYLWGVYILIGGVPLTFVIYSICCTKKEKEQEKSARAKKTDEPSPDDKPNENDENNAASNEANENQELSNEDDKASEPPTSEEEEKESNVPKNQNTSPKSKKSDLEVENNILGTTTNFDEKNSGTNENNITTENNIEEIGAGDVEEEINATHTTVTTTTTTEGARKRKPRRE